MGPKSTAFIKTALKAFHATGAHRLTPTAASGLGAIFMLHNVAPDTGYEFEPNSFLRVTPEFLEDVIGLVDDLGYETISLDEIPGRLAAGADAKPFVCFTFDDGYRDNRNYALPIMKKHSVPMAVYVPSDFADGTGDLWWLAFEKAIRQSRHIDIEVASEHFELPTRTAAEKTHAFNRIYWALRKCPEADARATVKTLCENVGYDPSGMCRDLIMSWDELRAFAQEPLVTIGAHTCGHYALAKLDDETAFAQMNESITRLEDELDLPCHHFSYPYGNEMACGPREYRFARRLGMSTAVTTRKGLIHASHKLTPTALPRLSLNGDYQDIRYVQTLLSGAPFALLQAYENLARLPSAARSLVSPRRLATSIG